MSSHGKGYAHRQRPKEIRFCPWCGVESLLRDDDHLTRSEQSPSWICATCGSGFLIRNSDKANLAVRLLRADAKLRVNLYGNDNAIPSEEIPDDVDSLVT